MLGFIFEAVAGLAHGAAKTVEDVGERIGAPAWITAGVSGALSACALGAEKVGAIEVPSMNIGASLEGMKSFFTPSHEMAEAGPAPKLGRSGDYYNSQNMNISQDLPSQSQVVGVVQNPPMRNYAEVDVSDIGHLPPPIGQTTQAVFTAKAQQQATQGAGA